MKQHFQPYLQSFVIQIYTEFSKFSVVCDVLLIYFPVLPISSLKRHLTFTAPSSDSRLSEPWQDSIPGKVLPSPTVSSEGGFVGHFWMGRRLHNTPFYSINFITSSRQGPSSFSLNSVLSVCLVCLAFKSPIHYLEFRPQWSLLPIHHLKGRFLYIGVLQASTMHICPQSCRFMVCEVPEVLNCKVPLKGESTI